MNVDNDIAIIVLVYNINIPSSDAAYFFYVQIGHNQRKNHATIITFVLHFQDGSKTTRSTALTNGK